MISIAARTRDRSALASREKYPCHGVVDPRQSRRQPLDLPPTPIDWMFSFCSHGAQECPDVNAWQHSKKSEAETTALVEAEVAEAIASCGGDVRAAFARDLND